MKLCHPDYTFQMEFREGIVQKLVVEAPEVMSEFIIDLKDQLQGNEGKWCLSHEGEILRVSDSCDLIMDIFDVDINQRKILNVLYEEMAHEIMDTNLLVDWRNVNSNVEMILNQAIDGIGYDISFGEVELKALFKLVDLQFREKAEDHVSYLLEYLQLMSEVRKIRLFIIVNITSFLTRPEMEYLYEEMAYKKYNLLLLDVQNMVVKKEMEHTIILDKDYCVIDTSVK